MTRNIEALLLYLERRGPLAHAFGHRANDCIAFLDGAVRAQTGQGFLGKLQWTDERSGLRLLKAEGGVEAAFDRRFERIAPALARRGDIAGVPHARLGLHPMLAEGRTLAAPGARGLKRCPRSAMTVAWDVTRVKDARVPAAAHQPSRERAKKKARAK